MVRNFSFCVEIEYEFVARVVVFRKTRGEMRSIILRTHPSVFMIGLFIFTLKIEKESMRLKTARTFYYVRFGVILIYFYPSFFFSFSLCLHSYVCLRPTSFDFRLSSPGQVVTATSSCHIPGGANRTFGNRTQSNPIEPNRSIGFDWVR